MVMIGDRKKYVTIQVATRTSDGQGGYTTSWTSTYYEWAQVTYLSGSRVLDSGGVNYRVSAELIMRKRLDTPVVYTLSVDHRLYFDSSYWTIWSVIPIENDNLRVLVYA